MPRKLTIDHVKSMVEERGGKLLSATYKNYREPLHILTSDGIEEYRSLASISQSTQLISKQLCAELTKENQGYDQSKVANIVAERGGKKIGEYINESTPFLIITSDGAEEYRTLRSIRQSTKLISKEKRDSNVKNSSRFTLDEVKNLILAKGGKLLEENYVNKQTPILVKTVDGVIEKRNLASIMGADKLYSNTYYINKKRKSLEYVREAIESRGGKLVSTSYTGCRENIELYCSCGNLITNSIFNIEQNHNPTITCSQCRPPSKFQIEVEDFCLHHYDAEIKTNCRTVIPPFEVDIYLPDANLAIECNGIFWHSESQGKDKNYHFRKWDMCNEMGIDLIQVLDVDWYHKMPIVKDIILKRIGIVDRVLYARKCIVKSIPQSIASDFLLENHLQGSIYAKYNYGLYYDEELVSLISLSQSRFSKDGIELYRFCNKLGVSITGGFSKLIKTFINEENPEKVLSYCDVSYFNGSVYESNGFTLSHHSSPNYKYFNTSNTQKLYSRNKFQKHKLNSELDFFDESLSEIENMKKNGYDRIWDCGNKVYVLDLSNK